LGAQPS